jgi:hypothetical protein
MLDISIYTIYFILIAINAEHGQTDTMAVIVTAHMTEPRCPLVLKRLI